MKAFSFLFIACCLLISKLEAQHSTLNFSDSPINLTHQSLLIVPFDSRMYLSDINEKLAIENNLNSDEIVERFIAGVDQSIYYTFRERCDVSSFYILEDENTEEELSYIYSQLKLEYELVSKTQEKTRLEKFKGKLKKSRNEKYDRGGISNGEIVTVKDERERYMKAVVQDNKMLDSMHFKFDNKFFLFINQLDITNQYADAVSMEQMNYSRQIKLHYTLYHRNGEILSTGISSTTFPSHQNDINIIISEYFPILAEQIFNDLFEVEEAEEKSSKLKLWK